jgi:CBS domain-containing protein
MNVGWRIKLGWAPIKVKEKMSSDVELVSPDIFLTDIGKTMREKKTGCVLVEENGRLIGIITDRDIACRATADGADYATITASAIMSKPVSYCFDDARLVDAAHIMQEKQVGRLPVLDRETRLVGMLTADHLSSLPLLASLIKCNR